MAAPPQYMSANDAATDEFANFPPSLSGDLCWDANTFRNAQHKYIIHLTPEDVSSVERAVTFFKGFSRYCVQSA